jgi:hypothetical protein
MAGEESEDLSEGFRGLPLESKTGVDGVLGSGVAVDGDRTGSDEGKGMGSMGGMRSSGIPIVAGADAGA